MERLDFWLIGVVLAIVFYFLSLKEKKPWWTIASTNMIKGGAWGQKAWVIRRLGSGLGR